MLSPDRLERLRGYLLNEQASLREQISRLDAVPHELNVGLGNHMAEDATAAFDQATAVSLRRGKERALKEVDHALERMDVGAYGACQRCGAEIDFARLKAIPYAMLCMTCQKIVEL